MPEASQAEIGRRMYHVQREKRVERAVKLIQQGLGPEWKLYTGEKMMSLGHLSQCTWKTSDQDLWEKIPFPHARKRAFPELTMTEPYCSITGETTMQVSAKTRAPLFSILSTILAFLSITPCAAKT